MRYGKMEKKESRLTGKAKFVESRQCLRVGRVCEEERPLDGLGDRACQARRTLTRQRQVAHNLGDLF